jgi:hypothetical protein
VMQRQGSYLHASLLQGNRRLLAQPTFRRHSIEYDPGRFACNGGKIQRGANRVQVERCRATKE